MISIQQKADILRKARMAPPILPTGADETALDAWTREIEQCFVAYSAARAAQSLRDAEEARQREMLRRMAWSSASA